MERYVVRRLDKQGKDQYREYYYTRKVCFVRTDFEPGEIPPYILKSRWFFRMLLRTRGFSLQKTVRLGFYLVLEKEPIVEIRV